MKLKSKVLIALFLFVALNVIFLTNSVFAVGRVAQSWMETINGKRVLVFRTYTNPLPETVEEYHNEVRAITSKENIVKEDDKTWTYITPTNDTATSKWIYDGNMQKPSHKQFATYRMTFHNEMFCNYTKKGTWGYSQITGDITKDISSIEKTINNSVYRQNIEPTLKSGVKTIYEIDKFKGRVLNINSIYIATGKVLTDLVSGTPVELRHAIVKIGNSNVYVADNIIQGDNLTQLISKLNGNNECYVSEELIVETISDRNVYEFAETAADFIKIQRGWNTNTFGTANLGRGSALNLYDNLLIFPQTSKREVYVRYINLGENGTVQKSTIYTTDVKHINSKSNEQKIKVSNTNVSATKTKFNLTNPINEYVKYCEEYYEGIEITKSVKKEAIDREKEGYIYVGYNAAVANTVGMAQRSISNKVKSGKYQTEKTVEIEGKNQDASDDVIVIDFYYKEKPEEIIDEPDDKEEVKEPERDIPGKVFVESTDDIKGECIDNEDGGYSIVSIPSGTNARVGIEGIPKYMIGAIDLQNIGNKNNNLKVILEFKAGPHTKSREYNLNYATEYYAVKNMLMYKLNLAKIYDSGVGYDSTLGEEMFSWDKGVFSLLPGELSIGLNNIKMYGLNSNIAISNNESSITDIKNYISTTITYSFNGTSASYSATGLSEITIPYTYLTNAEYKKIENIIKEQDGKIDDSVIEKVCIDQNDEQICTYLTKYKQYVANDPESTKVSNDLIARTFNLKAEFNVANMKVEINGKQLFEDVGTKTYTISFDDLEKKHVISTDKPTIVDKENKYKNNFDGSVIKRTDYTNSSLINKDALNGVRALSGSVQYTALSIIGNEDTVTDTVYYGENTVFNLAKGNTLSKTYKVDLTATKPQTKYEEVQPVNVYTPITVTTEIISNKNEVVDQTELDIGSSLIQINTPFTIKISNQKGESIVYKDSSGAQKYSISTSKFNLGYYIKFDFDVHKVKIDGLSYKNGQKISAGTWIGFLKGNDVEVTVQAYGSVSDNVLNILSEEKGTYTVRAVAYNASKIIRDAITLYSSWEIMQNSDDKFIVENICMEQSYFAETTNNLLIINRMYDFRVTDVKDIEWKTTFRTTTGSVVNKHTGNVYYSGTTKWDTSTTSKVNNIVNRTVSEIGRSPLRILPIGPYKNTDIGKMSAPKLGYRLSFDFKVTGSYYKADGTVNTSKKVNVNTKFYYISKDGKTFIEESTGSEGIYLFYKNSNGKYVRIDNSGGGYNLKFTPQDGYRYVEATTNTLSTSSISLGNLRNMTLNYNMATPSNNRTYITYYGEYKLPNSTIAVKVDSNGKYDINKPLTDGYLGVIFDIYADTGKITINGVQKSVVLRYGKDTAGVNTSQWDYEGFLGFKNYGNKVKTGELSLKLEKGAWQITNDIYNKIKGTVILYDMDERAATDFE